MSKRGIAVLVVVTALLLPVLGVAGYTAVTRWALPDPPDECDLLTIPEAQQILGGTDAEVVRRIASPGNTMYGWSYSCTYRGNDGGADVNELRISVLTGTPAEGNIGVMDGKRLTGLGAEAWAGQAYGVLRSGSTQVQVSFRGLGRPHNAHDVPEQALRKLAGRLSTVPDFPEADVSGVCDRLDVAAAEDVAGSELPGRRAVIRANGDVSCMFSGAKARFEVAVASNTDLLGGKRIGQGDIPVRGVPVKAVEDHYEPAHKIHFAIDGRMYTIGLDPDGGAPPPQETDIPRSVLDTFEDCGDNLAKC
jgi:hypothetical protein